MRHEHGPVDGDSIVDDVEIGREPVENSTNGDSIEPSEWSVQDGEQHLLKEGPACLDGEKVSPEEAEHADDGRNAGDGDINPEIKVQVILRLRNPEARGRVQRELLKREDRRVSVLLVNADRWCTVVHISCPDS